MTTTIKTGDILQNQTDSSVCCVGVGEAVEVKSIDRDGSASVSIIGTSETDYLYPSEVARLTVMVEEPEEETEVEVTMNGSEVFITGTGPAVAQVVYALALATALR